MKVWITLAVLLPVLAVAQSNTEPAPVDGAVEASEKQVGGTFPRYASLKKAEVNVRSGPGNDYPTLWIYQRAAYPVQLLARYDNYYKIRDAEAEEGWVYVGMISAKKTGLVGGKTPVPLYHKADLASDVEARLAPNVVVDMDVCEASTNLCRVEVGPYKGWVDKAKLLMVD